MSLSISKRRLQNLIKRTSEISAEAQHSDEIEMVIKDLDDQFNKYISILETSNVDIEDVASHDEFDKFEKAYYTAKMNLKRKGSELGRSSNPQEGNQNVQLTEFLSQQRSVIEMLTQSSTRASTQASDQASAQSATVQLEQQLRLPKMMLPKFSGEYKQWVTFRDLFETAVINNNSLSDIQKFSYLKSLLTGQAASLISSMPLEGRNFQRAWELIKSRFDKPYLLIQSIISEIVKLKVSPEPQKLRMVTSLLFESWETLKSQGEYARSPDPWAISIFLERIDTDSRKAWSEHTSQSDSPSVDEFLEFLEARCAAEEIFSATSQTKCKLLPTKASALKFNFSKVSDCIYCHQNHIIYKCQSFKALSNQKRKEFIAKEKRCTNCFHLNHSVSECRSKFSCSSCKGKHNSLLHEPRRIQSDASETCQQEENPTVQIMSSVGNHFSLLLPTAVLRVKNIFGQFIEFRALLDSGAQANLMTESLFQRLGVKREYSRLPITSLTSEGTIYSKGKTHLKLFSHFDKYNFEVSVHILNSVMNDLPSNHIQIQTMDRLQREFSLADPTFNIPSPIDMILGASTFFMLLKRSRYLQTQDQIFLQETRIGFVVCGSEESCKSELMFNNITISPEDLSLERQLERFWNLEEPKITRYPLTLAEEECEKFFAESTTRLADGRFSVRLPFKNDPRSLNHSRQMAQKRFFALERKLHANPDLLSEYRRFMLDYESLGHMEKLDLPSFPFDRGQYFVIPHHAIWQQGVTKKKLRVVFDASAMDESGTSLNEFLHTGPALQVDIIKILLSFRQFKWVMTADIEKMYRQIQVDQRDQNYQLIFWRPSPKQSLNLYRLKTVTYGQACSPFLAIRTIHELVSQDGPKFPLAARFLRESSYVDDIFFGSDSIVELKLIQSELISLLSLGGFSLKKWASNSWETLKHLKPDELSNPKIFDDSTDGSIKTLGVKWEPKSDHFFFQYNPCPVKEWSKRELLSETARIYDPCGWLSPITVLFKILFQQTWVQQTGWDGVLPENILSQWKRLRDDLSNLSSIKIPRYTRKDQYEIHGFADASKDAYGAAIYIRSIDDRKKFSTHLLFAKSRIAPIKQVSIPRLELCAAHLLARCIHQINETFPCTALNTFLWSDSKCVLAWLKSTPKRWTPFVGNRVSHIHELCPCLRWYYVNTKQNPADFVSRGSLPSKLVSNQEWWTGPAFLSQPFDVPPEAISSYTTDEECTIKVHTRTIETPFWIAHITRFSSFNRLVRSLAYVFRFFDILKHKKRFPASLSAEEITKATEFIVLKVQEASYGSVIKALLKSQSFPKQSPIRKLDPFLDENGLLRVGGRLKNVKISQFNSTPIIIPRCHLSFLLIQKFHHDTFHGGLRLLANLIRRTFWIPGLRQAINSFIHSCPRCQRYKGTTYEPSMGELPAARVNPSKPFNTTGIDFAGPFVVRPVKMRGNISVKAWVAVFVCFSTKAIHLELITDLSTDALIRGLRRFIARRGRCATFVSDNGKNFVGCATLLKTFQKEVRACASTSEVQDFLSSQLIEWKFIPGYSPHFGGLWERGVRSLKGHLLKTFNGSTLSLDEMMTVLCQIESILNSRPLTPLSFTEPTEHPITPSHLLTGEPMTVLPEILSRSQDSSSVRQRSTMLSNLTRGFWKRWRNDYLDSIMKKPKWNFTTRLPRINDVVLVKRDSDPPNLWVIGRIEATYPAKDGSIRVVDVRTSRHLTRESSRNLVPLNVNA